MRLLVPLQFNQGGSTFICHLLTLHVKFVWKKVFEHLFYFKALKTLIPLLLRVVDLTQASPERWLEMQVLRPHSR